MITAGKSFICLILFCNCLLPAHPQNNRWILGEWKGIGITPGSAYSTVFVRTMIIKTEYKNRLAGILIQEVMDNKGTRIEKELTGNFVNNEIKVSPGRTSVRKTAAPWLLGRLQQLHHEQFLDYGYPRQHHPYL